MEPKQKKYLIVAAVVVITAAAAFLRLYRHRDLLHFQLDQARDMIVIGEAINNGPGELPLLGPRAGGTMVRLGPIFYYFLYLFAAIFGNYPDKVALYEVLTSIGAVPLLYLLLRTYFSRTASLAVTLVSSVSLFAVVYGRFSWNPNSLPFFTILLLYGLIKSVDRNAGRRKRIYSMYLAALALAVATQLHFLAFIALPVTVAAFILFIILQRVWAVFAKERKKGIQGILQAVAGIGWRKLPWIHFGFAVLLFAFLNLPIIVNEYLTGGANTGQFFAAITKKAEKEEAFNNTEKLFHGPQEYARGYYLIVTGNQKAEIINALFWRGGRAFDFQCSRICREALPYSIAAFVFSGGGMVLLFLRLIGAYKKKGKEHAVDSKANLLVITTLLFSIVFFGFFSLAYGIRPRFFLLTFPIPFIFLGLWFELFLAIFTRMRKYRIGQAVVLVAAGFLAYTNILAVAARFQEQAHTFANDPLYMSNDMVLREGIRITLKDEEDASRWIVENADQDTVYVWALPEYYRPFTYLLRKNHNKDARKLGTRPKCKDADYFAVVPADSPESFLIKGGEYFAATGITQSIGSVIVQKLAIKDPEAVRQTCPRVLDPDEADEDESAQRFKFKEIFSGR